MKQLIVASLFFLCILLGILSSSCNTQEKTENPISSVLLKKIDSLNNFYYIASQTTLTQSERFEIIDNFLMGAEKLDIDSLQYKGLKLKSNILFRNGYIKPAIEESKKYLRLAQQNNDSNYMGKASYKIGFLYRSQSNYIDAFNHYNQSFKILRNIKDSINAGKCLMAMANIQKNLGDHNASKTTSIDGLTYVKYSTEHNTISGLYHNISIAYKELGNYGQALLWNNKILINDSLSVKKLSKNDLTNILNTRANILARQKQHSRSVSILETLLKKKDLQKQPLIYARVLSNLGHIKFLQNPENSESETMLLEALKIRLQKNTSSGLISSNVHLTKFYKNKDTIKALSYAREAYKNAKIKNNYESLVESLNLVTELDPTSIKDHQLFKEASLNLMDLRKQTREIYAPTRYENENLLKENEEKNQKILHVRNQNTVYLLGIALLITGIGFVSFFFRQRTHYLKQQNKIVQFQASYETETRISKRLHDELGNNIFQVMLQYQNNPHDPQITNQLNNAYAKARDISRENSEFEIDETYTAELTNMLRNYTKNGIRLILRGLDKIAWDTIDKTIKITLYRVLQELMTNMQKHSQATLVAVIFDTDNNTLIIKYSDNGLGMSPEDLTSKNGLRNTEKRIQAIDGTIIFDSEKDKGFKAEIRISN